MGLTARGFETATLTDPHDYDDESCHKANHVRAFIIDPAFHRSLRGLTADRCYAVSGREESASQTYSGHGDFRERLARTFLGVEASAIWASPDEYVDRPFFELINFADNEGTIGPEAAADLLADFEEGRYQWVSSLLDDPLGDRYARMYDDWTEVFRIAASSGLVRFA